MSPNDSTLRLIGVPTSDNSLEISRVFFLLSGALVRRAVSVCIPRDVAEDILNS